MWQCSKNIITFIHSSFCVPKQRMLTSLHLVRITILNYTLNNFDPLALMYQNNLVYTCSWIINHMYTIFNMKNRTVGLNNIHQFQVFLRILMRTREPTDRQTNPIRCYSSFFKIVKKANFLFINTFWRTTKDWFFFLLLLFQFLFNALNF